MDIKELLDQFTLFDPAKGQRTDSIAALPTLPDAPMIKRMHLE